MSNVLYYEFFDTSDCELSEELTMVFRKVLEMDEVIDQYLYPKDVNRIELIQKLVSDEAAKELNRIVKLLNNGFNVKLSE